MANRVGGEVDALCTKCKMSLAHTIIAMVGDKIVRVQCNTCRGQHAYKGASATVSKPRTTKARSASGSAASSRAAITFDQLLADKDLQQAKKYSPKETFAKDDLVEHPNFGYGVVMEARGDKVNVLFKMAEKTLIHGRGEGGAAARPAFSPPRGSSGAASDKPMTDEEASAANEPAPGEEPA